MQDDILEKIKQHSLKYEKEQASIYLASAKINKFNHDQVVAENIGSDKDSRSIIKEGLIASAAIAAEVLSGVQVVLRLTAGYLLSKQHEEVKSKTTPIKTLGIRA